MSEMEIKGASGHEDITFNAMQKVQKENQQELIAEQLSSKDSLKESQEEVVNPFAQKFATKQKDIETQKPRFVQKKEETGASKDAISGVEEATDFQDSQEFAEQFQQENPEVRSEVLLLLKDQIKPGDTKEEILATIAKYYPDPALADKALEYLIKATKGELSETVKEARTSFQKIFSKEIAAGQYLSLKAKQASTKGLGSAGTLRELFKEIINNPRDSTTLFEELSTKYPFKELKSVIDFLLHTLGADTKTKGANIPRGLLHRLITETRSLQAILGVYNFFRGRMHLVDKMFEQQNVEKPAELTFENFAKQFMSLAADRYPTAAKVHQASTKLGVDKTVQGEIITDSQFRDAIRQVSMNFIFKSVEHRDALYLSTLEALEDLEDQLEELMQKGELN